MSWTYCASVRSKHVMRRQSVGSYSSRRPLAMSRRMSNDSRRTQTGVCISAEQPGAAKKGAGLLTGLLRCRRCGRKLTVRYTGSQHEVLRYTCNRGWLDHGEPRCIAFGGVPVDDMISKQVLAVVQPAAIEAAL